jgi:hypothetical protein
MTPQRRKSGVEPPHSKIEGNLCTRREGGLGEEFADTGGAAVDKMEQKRGWGEETSAERGEPFGNASG